ncbi:MULTISPECIES: alpha-galactosidase [unclassified Microbacterium]|uniref:alpha-galactosidase n=1 Tax=unclassified Microbacterium TaxID=2609290 RepID=UPI0012FA58C3|nr:alpha-galactosidase [Microbacterium sp. MAH-37]MVQ40826.1 family 10 glycosylhydrolase [Microbacterium sp. MAH-37]
MDTDVFHLTADDVSVVITADAGAMPAIAYWGRGLGELSPQALDDIATGTHRQRAVSEPDIPLPIGVLPEAGQGWYGPTGLAGHRAGRHPFPAFLRTGVREEEGAVVAHGVDDAAGVSLELQLELLPSGVLRTRATVTNDGDGAYSLEGMDLAVPVPARATELFDFSGRHNGERRPQRHALVDGTHLRENRRGRTGPDAVTLLAAGIPGFGFDTGEVWAAHLAWSGDQRLWAHRTNGGRSFLGGGEVLEPGELDLAPGSQYTSPWLYLTWGEGLDAASARLHRMLRARPSHPPVGRPITLNTWEAVYFDHSLPPLLELADQAAEVGIERFVLDDGWFRGRRHDRAGLGDWYEDEDVWPQGLGPLVDHVRERGMQFGLWFEPEMVNPDSDLARRHPDWLLSPEERDAPLARQQQVLNIGHPGAYAYIAGRLIDVITRYRVDYVKWDHNRDLTEPVDRSTGRAGVHRQTAAVYRLLHEVREACPWLEIESCSAGGGRIDLGIVEYVDRFWTSDSNDPLERQRIQRGTTLLMPPELLGSHVGAQFAHTTGRAASMTYRAVTALVASFGVEWDLREATPAERTELAGWIAIAKRLRPLTERGELHRLDTEAALVAQAVVAEDRAHALVTIAAIDSVAHSPGGALRVAGVDPDRRYRVQRLTVEGADDPTIRRGQPAWWLEQTEVAGVVLGQVGLPLPTLRPQEAGAIELIAV